MPLSAIVVAKGAAWPQINLQACAASLGSSQALPLHANLAPARPTSTVQPLRPGMDQITGCKHQAAITADCNANLAPAPFNPHLKTPLVTAAASSIARQRRHQ